ncbi:MAG: hypothetical protein IPN42_11760 [Methylococcaceae bacterium]|nr:hypothetical protein [Methylococcaceae bacterium]
MLTDKNWWLWSASTTREKFRLLAALCPQLKSDELGTLEQAILAGLPREMYREDLTEEKWQGFNDRKIWLHLAKLESFSITLSEQASVTSSTNIKI